MDEHERIRTVIIDHQEVFRRGLRQLLEETGEFVVVGEGASVGEARRLLAAQPDVATIEMCLPDGDGVQVLREARTDGVGTACVLLTEQPCGRAALSAIMAGAAGVVDKDGPARAVVEQLQAAACAGARLGHDAVEELLEDLVDDGAGTTDRTLTHLTPQEHRVFELVGQGLTNREVGEQLHLTEKTVKNYVSRILAKLGMEHRTEIAMLAGRLIARCELAS